MTFGAPPSNSNSRLKPSAPERGVFPLDHQGECQAFVNKYLQCLQNSNGQGCKEEAAR